MDPKAKALASRARVLELFRDPRRSPYAVIGRQDVPVGGEAVIDVPGQPVRVAERAGQFIVEGEREPLAPGAFVQRGRYVLKLSHQNFPAALLLDTENPRVSTGPLPRWFDYGDRYRVPAQLALEEPREVVVQSTQGHKRRALRLGFLEAELLGAPVRLVALRLLEPGVGEAALSIFFRDATSAHETYPVGRYLDPLPQDGGGYSLDFNRAYNPLCAFSPHFNCPIPPRENVLSLPVRAGELDPDPAAHAS